MKAEFEEILEKSGKTGQPWAFEEMISVMTAAYNLAISDAAEAAKVKVTWSKDHKGINRPVRYDEIDKQSILKLKIT